MIFKRWYNSIFYQKHKGHYNISSLIIILNIRILVSVKCKASNVKNESPNHDFTLKVKPSLEHCVITFIMSIQMKYLNKEVDRFNNKEKIFILLK